MAMPRLAILLSGRGSNFLAIHDAIRVGKLPAKIVVVISNRPDAKGIASAKDLGCETRILDHRAYSSREAHEEDVIAAIEKAGADFVILAGYMRLLSEGFVAAFPNRILNIHPALLPSFPGVDAQARALDHGVKITGCTVHFVDAGLDSGPIILQRVVEVRDDDTAESLAERILEQEHIAYPEAIRRVCTERFRIEGRRVVFG